MVMEKVWALESNVDDAWFLVWENIVEYASLVLRPNCNRRRSRMVGGEGNVAGGGKR